MEDQDFEGVYSPYTQVLSRKTHTFKSGNTLDTQFDVEHLSLRDGVGLGCNIYASWGELLYLDFYLFNIIGIELRSAWYGSHKLELDLTLLGFIFRLWTTDVSYEEPE